MGYKKAIIFSIAMTAILIVMGTIIKSNIFPMPIALTLPPFNKMWFRVAGVIGIFFPSIMLILYHHHEIVRKIFIPYLFVLGIQIISEWYFFRFFFPSMTIFIGIGYVGFRIWQWWVTDVYIRRFIKQKYLYYYFLLITVRLNFIFWGLLWIRLFFFRLPQLFGFS